MASQSHGLQQRTRTKTAPSFPRDRPQQQHPEQQLPLQTHQHQHQNNPSLPYVPSHTPHQRQHHPNNQFGEVESWRLQSLHSAPISGPPRRSSRGPRTASPIDPQARVFTWDQHNPFPLSSSSQRQHFRRKSITSNTSSSDQQTLLRSPRPSRSPSPGTPRTSLSSRTLRTPMSHESTTKRTSTRKMTGQSLSGGSNSSTGCSLETALVNSRRRIPYSMGSDAVAVVSPGGYQARLEEKDERCLSVDIQELYHQLLPTEDTEERRRLFIEKLNKILRQEFPNCYSEAHVFGSSENRLGTNSSDVDVCVVTSTKDMDDTCMLASILHSNNFEKVVCVAAAKVPVVKIWDPELNIHCDINVNNSLAIENTRLVKLYVDIDERVRPLAMIIKYWAKSRLLNDAAGGGTLTSYTWILMVINFLQTRDPPILPSLQKLPHRPRLSNGIDVGFFDDISKLKDYGSNSKNEETLGGLLYAFFVKFAFEFDYNHQVISVRSGGSLSKKEKGWHLMQNNSLCVEEPFNVKRNLGNTADEATVKGLQLEFRRAVHYLADHASLELACWQYQFPTAENPRPERHLPNLPPLYRQTTSSNNFKKTKYPRPQNSSPPFKSPKPRAQELGYQRNFNSFSGSRQQYHFNPLNLNHPLPPQVPIPPTPQSGMSSAMSPAADIHPAFPPTPVDPLHYIDPFKNRIAYYIPAFTPNGIPLYVPYTEDPVVYASPPQTPAMSETSLSHQPQYPRPQPYPFVPQYSRGQSVQRGRQPHRTEDIGSPPGTFQDPQPLTGIGMSTPGMSNLSPPYISTPTRRRNSLPPNNKPNILILPPKNTTEPYTPGSSILSQSLDGSVSPVGDSNVFEDFFEQRRGQEVPEPSETPRPPVEQNGGGKGDTGRSPGTTKESPGNLPSGKSYAAALLNIASAKSPTQAAVAVRKDSLGPAITITDKDKNKVNGVDKFGLTIDSITTSPSKRSERDDAPLSPQSASPLINHRKGSLVPTVWNNLHPSSIVTTIDITPPSPSVPISQGRRPSIHSLAGNSPKKPNRLAPLAKADGRRGSVINIPEPAVPEPSPSPAKKHRKKKGMKKKENNNNMIMSVSTINGISNRRQSVITNA